MPEEKTNFDEIRRVALRIAELEQTPELSKDYLVRLVASEQSLVEFMQGFATLIVICPTFSEVVDRTMMTTALNYMKFMKDKGF